MAGLTEAYNVNRARLMAIYTNLIRWKHGDGEQWKLFNGVVFESYLMRTNAAAAFWEERFNGYINTQITSAGNLDINGFPEVYECIGVNYTRRMRRDSIAYCFNTTAGSAQGVTKDYYFNPMKIIGYYARLMANIDIGVYNETENTKHPAVIAMNDSKLAKSARELWRQASDGEPVILADKELFSGTSTQVFPLPRESHIADKHAAKRVIVNEFLSTVGVYSLDFEKTERMITAEADASRTATTLCGINFQLPREEFCERFYKLYRESIDFEFRPREEIEKNVNDVINTDQTANNIT